MFDQSKMIYLYIQTSLQKITTNAQDNIDLIDNLLITISTFLNLDIIKSLLQALRTSYYNKIEKKVIDIDYNFSTYLGLSEECQVYLRTNGQQCIPTDPVIKEILDLILNR